jgi:hypothetical protein
MGSLTNPVMGEAYALSRCAATEGRIATGLLERLRKQDDPKGSPCGVPLTD